MRQLFALLVGINDYPIKPLTGCVADIRAYKQFLTHRVNSTTHELHLEILVDHQATREAVIGGFCSHLRRAGADDTALFVFCGHGSRQPTAAQHLKIEPDRYDETIVCYDSRAPF